MTDYRSTVEPRLRPSGSPDHPEWKFEDFDLIFDRQSSIQAKITRFFKWNSL